MSKFNWKGQLKLLGFYIAIILLGMGIQWLYSNEKLFSFPMLIGSTFAVGGIVGIIIQVASIIKKKK